MDKIHLYDIGSFDPDEDYDGLVTTISGKDVLTVPDPCVPVEPGDGAGNPEDVYVNETPTDVKQTLWDGTWFDLVSTNSPKYSFEQFGGATSIYRNNFILAWEMQVPAAPTGGLIRLDVFPKATSRDIGATYLWCRAYWYGDAGGKGTGQMRTHGGTNKVADSEWWEGTAGGNTFATELAVKQRSKINGNYRQEFLWSHPDEEDMGQIGFIFDDTYTGVYHCVMRVVGGADGEIQIRGLTSEGHEEKFCTLYLGRQAIWDSPAWVIPQDAKSVDTLFINTNEEISGLLNDSVNPVQISTNGGSVWQDLGADWDLTALGDPPVAGDDMRVRISFDAINPERCIESIRQKPIIYDVGVVYESEGYRPSADMRRVI